VTSRCFSPCSVRSGPRPQLHPAETATVPTAPPSLSVVPRSTCGGLNRILVDDVRSCLDELPEQPARGRACHRLRIGTIDLVPAYLADIASSSDDDGATRRF